MNMQLARNKQGFTLIELLIVVAIIGILAAIAYPQYVQYVVRSKRAEGRSALLAAAQNQERFFSNNNTFTATLAQAGIQPYSGATLAGAAYTISIAPGTAGGQTIANSFVVTATPNATQIDPECATMTLDHTQTKTISGTGTWQGCWR
jgi:type IV pilus assembly protein PilE